jgi:hypothetical protein
MDISTNTNARRTEDIALDLLKFVAAHANLGAKSSSTPGFGIPSSAKPEDQIDHIFALYARCRTAVESPVDPPAAAQK